MRTLISLMVCFLLASTNSCGQVQSSSTEKQIKTMLTDFYTSYIRAFASSDVANEKQLELLQIQYCTKSFLLKIPEIIERTEADPFLKAQDSDISYIETLSVSKDQQKKNEYIVSYTGNGALGTTNKIVIHLTIVKEKDRYKIDNVW